jgi:glycosyltransferase involved in cell wall biosynthesis
LIERGVAAHKISLIYNWCDETSMGGRPTIKVEPGHNHPDRASAATFGVLFAGNIGKAQDMDAVLEAARLLQTENSSIRIMLLGGGVEVPRLKEAVEMQHIANVSFLPRVPMSQASILLAQADALLVHLKDDPLFRITIPAKTQAYMAAGKAIVMAVAGDASRLVMDADAGICALPSNARSIADAIQKLAALPRDDLQKMGRNGREFYWSNMSMEVGARRFLAIFQQCI